MREDQPTFCSLCGAGCGRDVKAFNLIVQVVCNHNFEGYADRTPEHASSVQRINTIITPPVASSALTPDQVD